MAGLPAAKIRFTGHFESMQALRLESHVARIYEPSDGSFAGSILLEAHSDEKGVALVYFLESPCCLGASRPFAYTLKRETFVP